MLQHLIVEVAAYVADGVMHMPFLDQRPYCHFTRKSEREVGFIKVNLPKTRGANPSGVKLHVDWCTGDIASTTEGLVVQAWFQCKAYVLDQSHRRTGQLI